MTVSFLLRLVPDELRRGQLVGRLRVVATGEERVFRDAAELASAAGDALAATGDQPTEAPDRPAQKGAGGSG